MNIKKFINKALLSAPMSKNELLKKMDTNVILYNDIEHCDSLRDITGDKNSCVILYGINAENNGHWVLLLYHPKRKSFEFFDSYGENVDNILYDGLNHDKSQTPYLTNLILQEKGLVEYNDHPLQKLDRGVSICGRWCYTRYIFRDYTIDQFIKFFEGKQTLTPDEIVCLMCM